MVKNFSYRTLYEKVKNNTISIQCNQALSQQQAITDKEFIII